MLQRMLSSFGRICFVVLGSSVGLAFGVPPARALLATGTTMDTTAYTVVLHVDAVAGNDANDGSSKALAVKTIGKAFTLARTPLTAKTGVKVLIHPGRYSEPKIVMDGTGFEQAGSGGLFVVEGAAAGQVVISGSERAGWEASTWTRVHPDSFSYSHPWPYTWPWECGTNPPTSIGCIGWHREMVIFNRVNFEQVVLPTNLRARKFYVNETAKTVTIRLDRAIQTSDLIEIPVRTHLFRVMAKNKVAVKKIIFEHENSYIQGATNDGDGWGVAVGFRTEGRTRTTDLLIEDCEFRQCNSAALKLNNCNNVTIRRCKANDNGWKGIGVGNCTNVLIENSEASYNCWRQMWSGGRGWDAAGVKIIPSVSRLTIRNHYADSNTVASGIWLDWGNTDITLDNCTIERHRFDPLYIECTTGPTTIINSTVRNSIGGITSFGSSNNRIENCRFEKIGGFISLIADSRAQCTNNANFYVRGCYIQGSGRIFGSATWANFFSTLDIDSNRYYYGANSITSNLFSNASGAAANFTQWQALGKDVHSQWLSAAEATPVAPKQVAPTPARRSMLIRTDGSSGKLDISYGEAGATVLRAVDLRGRVIAISKTGRLHLASGSGICFISARGESGAQRTRPVVTH